MSGSLYQQAIQAAQTYGVPPDLFTSIIAGESNWNPNAVSSTGAQGLGQVLPSTARQPGYGVTPLSNPFDATSNLNFSAQYLAALRNRSGSWSGAVNAYSGTPAGGTPYANNNQQSNILAAIANADGTSPVVGGGMTTNASATPVVGGGMITPTSPYAGGLDPNGNPIAAGPGLDVRGNPCSSMQNLLGLGGCGNASTTGSPSAPGGATTGTSNLATPGLVSGWVDQVFNKLGGLASRGALIAVGFLLMVGAFLIFAHGRET